MISAHTKCQADLINCKHQCLGSVWYGIPYILALLLNSKILILKQINNSGDKYIAEDYS